MSSASLRTNQIATASGSCRAIPSHITGWLKKERHVPCVNQALEKTTKRADPENGQRQRRVPARAEPSTASEARMKTICGACAR